MHDLQIVFPWVLFHFIYGIVLFKIFIYLAALSLSCSTWDIHCIMQELLLQHADSLVVACGLCICVLGLLIAVASHVAEHGL